LQFMDLDPVDIMFKIEPLAAESPERKEIDAVSTHMYSLEKA